MIHVDGNHQLGKIKQGWGMLGMNVVETSDICFVPGCFETLQLKHLEDRTDETKQDDLNRFQQQEVARIK